MVSYNPTGISLSPSEKDILMFLYTSRGAKTNQILRYFSSFPTTTEKGNLAKYLASLKKKKMICIQSIADKKEKLYFLSEDGHYLCSNYFKYKKEALLLDGFNGDVGDFPYTHYTPPKNYVSHFLMGIDLMLDVLEVRKKLSWNFRLSSKKKHKLIKNVMKVHKVIPRSSFKVSLYTIKNFNTGIDRRFKDNKSKFKKFVKPLSNILKYRDNLHAAISLVESSKKYYRPDAEILIHDNAYAVELDRGNERKHALKSKFLTYNERFKQLEKNGDPLPTGVLFITPDFPYENARIKRWHSVSSAFLEEVGEYAQKINLVMLTVSEVKKYLYNQTNKLKMKTYDMNLKNAIDKKVITSFGNITNEAYNMLVSFYADTNTRNILYNKPLYTFVHIEGYETKGWAILKELAKEYQLEKSVGKGELQSFVQINPFITFNYKQPIVIHSSFINQHFKSILKYVVYYNLTTGDLKPILLEGIKDSLIDN